uniref:hypothetical protein n=1 Tax=Providencia rettgeri TaxID=587 RepID=UPI003EBA1CDA
MKFLIGEKVEDFRDLKKVFWLGLGGIDRRCVGRGCMTQLDVSSLRKNKKDGMVYKRLGKFIVAFIA